MSDSKIGAQPGRRQHPAERQRSRVVLAGWFCGGRMGSGGWLRATFLPVRYSSWRMRLRV